MKRLIPVLLFCGLTNACAVVDMPGGGQDDPEWMDNRVAETEGADQPPVSVPNQRLDPGAERAITSGIEEVLSERETLDDDAASLEAFQEPGQEDPIESAPGPGDAAELARAKRGLAT